ncbi:hypothetical protein NL676_033787 [Syzygium grande]|nr:hypothetical protein NL676_033787 [Syzygium grande]
MEGWRSLLECVFLFFVSVSEIPKLASGIAVLSVPTFFSPDEFASGEGSRVLAGPGPQSLKIEIRFPAGEGFHNPMAVRTESGIENTPKIGFRWRGSMARGVEITRLLKKQNIL